MFLLHLLFALIRPFTYFNIKNPNFDNILTQDSVTWFTPKRAKHQNRDEEKLLLKNLCGNRNHTCPSLLVSCPFVEVAIEEAIKYAPANRLFNRTRSRKSSRITERGFLSCAVPFVRCFFSPSFCFQNFNQQAKLLKRPTRFLPRNPTASPSSRETAKNKAGPRKRRSIISISCRCSRDGERKQMEKFSRRQRQ